MDTELCANYGHHLGCCAWSSPMKVKKCIDAHTEYYVYQLPQPPECPSTYCAGDKPPCPQGTYLDEEGVCKGRPTGNCYEKHNNSIII